MGEVQRIEFLEKSLKDVEYSIAKLNGALEDVKVALSAEVEPLNFNDSFDCLKKMLKHSCFGDLPKAFDELPKLMKEVDFPFYKYGVNYVDVCKLLLFYSRNTVSKKFLILLSNEDRAKFDKLFIDIVETLKKMK